MSAFPSLSTLCTNNATEINMLLIMQECSGLLRKFAIYRLVPIIFTTSLMEQCYFLRNNPANKPFSSMMIKSMRLYPQKRLIKPNHSFYLELSSGQKKAGKVKQFVLCAHNQGNYSYTTAGKSKHASKNTDLQLPFPSNNVNSNYCRRLCNIMLVYKISSGLEIVKIHTSKYIFHH